LIIIKIEEKEHMSHRIGKTILISALVSILLMSSQTLFATSILIEPPDSPPQEILDRLRSFHTAFNLQSPQAVLQSFIQDDDPAGPPQLEFMGLVIGRDNIAQRLADFFDAYPGATIKDICLIEWTVDLEGGIGDIVLISVALTDGETIGLVEGFFLIRRGADWLIQDGIISDDEPTGVECLIPLPINTVGGVTASTNKLTVAAPYLVIVGLIAGLVAVVTVKMKRKD
jgi:hypothetical protein